MISFHSFKLTGMGLVVTLALVASSSNHSDDVESRIDCSEVIYGGQGQIEFASLSNNGCPSVLVLGPIVEDASVSLQDERRIFVLPFEKGGFPFISRFLQDRSDGFRDVLEPETWDSQDSTFSYYSALSSVKSLIIPAFDEVKQPSVTTKIIGLANDYTTTAFYHKIALKESNNQDPQPSLWRFIRRESWAPFVNIVAYIPGSHTEADILNKIDIPQHLDYEVQLDPSLHVLVLTIQDIASERIVTEFKDGLLEVSITEESAP